MACAGLGSLRHGGGTPEVGWLSLLILLEMSLDIAESNCEFLAVLILRYTNELSGKRTAESNL